MAQSAAQDPPPPVPLGGQPPVVYKDSWTDIAFIALCRIAYGNIAGWQSERSWTDGGETFRGMVEVSRSMMKGRSAAEQREAVIQGFPEVCSLGSFVQQQNDNRVVTLHTFAAYGCNGNLLRA